MIDVKCDNGHTWIFIGQVLCPKCARPFAFTKSGKKWLPVPKALTAKKR